MVGFALRFLPAVILGLILSLGTLFIDRGIGTVSTPPCSECLSAGGTIKLDGRGFPFSYAEDEISKSTNITSSLSEQDIKLSSFGVTSFMANWAVWSVVSFAVLLLLTKLRNILGTVAIAGLAVGLILVYLGIITLV